MQLGNSETVGNFEQVSKQFLACTVRRTTVFHFEAPFISMTFLRFSESCKFSLFADDTSIKKVPSHGDFQEDFNQLDNWMRYSTLTAVGSIITTFEFENC